MPSKTKALKRELDNRRYEERRNEAAQLLGGVCTVCGTTEDLDFDHVDPSTKLFNISGNLNRRADVFWAEVAKCQLLCRPHHIEKSRVDGSSSGAGLNKIQTVCGTMHSYQAGSCRCPRCLRARNLYRKGLVAYREVVD